VRILVLEHDPDVPAWLLADWAQRRGHRLDVVAVRHLRRWPEHDELEAVVSLGSEASAHGSPDPWIDREVEFLAAAHERAIPILGICFGGQTLARALGGIVAPAPRPEVTWREIERVDPELITSGPWVLWHEDLFTLPPGARLLAGSDSETIAFACGTSVGLQFHPEADAELTRRWIEGARRKLVSYGVDQAELEDETERRGAGARDRAFDLFDRIARSWKTARVAGRTALG
jgi:GMP synthase-like glutamine amidotransferase